MSKRRKESFSSSDCSNTDKSFSDDEKPKKKNPKKKKTLISDDEVSNLATESVGNTKKRVRRSAKEDPFEKQLRLAMEMSLKETAENNKTEKLSKEPIDSTEKKISQSPENDLPDLDFFTAKKSTDENKPDLTNKELDIPMTTEPDNHITAEKEILTTTKPEIVINKEQEISASTETEILITKDSEIPTTSCIDLISPQKDTNNKKASSKKTTKKEAKIPKKSKFESESESNFEDEDVDFDVKRSKKKATPAKKKTTPAKKKNQQSSAEKKKKITSNIPIEPDVIEEVLTPRRSKRSNSTTNSADKNKSAEKSIPEKTEDFTNDNMDQENIDLKVNVKKSLDMTEKETVLTENTTNKIEVPKSATHDLLPKHVCKLPAKTAEKFLPAQNEEKSAVSSGFKALAIPARLTANAPSSTSPLGRIEIKNNSPIVRVGLSRNKKIPSLHKNVKPF